MKNWASTRVEHQEVDLKRKKLAPYSAQEKAAALAGATSRAQARLSKFRLMQGEWAIPGWNAAAAAGAHPKNTLSVGALGGALALTKADMLNILGHPQEFASDVVQARLQVLWAVAPTSMKKARTVRQVEEGPTQ